MIHALHGTVGSSFDWTPLQRVIKLNGETLNAHDLWQYCKRGGADLWQFASLFNDSVARDTKMPPQDLLGYSMGGRLALHALIQNPSQWRSAVIVSAHTGLHPSLRKERQQSDLQWAELAAEKDSSWQSFLEKWNDQGVLKSSDKPPNLEWFDRQLLASHRSEIATSFKKWSLGRQDDLLERLPEVNTPVLWIVGERDHKFLAIAKEAVARLPHAQLLIIPDAGHRVPWEAPEAFNHAVLEWLDAQ